MPDDYPQRQVKFVPDPSLPEIIEVCLDCAWLARKSCICTREEWQNSEGLHGGKAVNPTWPRCVLFEKRKTARTQPRG
jgi:hypothetical protein